MLCSICRSINIDELIPPPGHLDSGVISGTLHHASFGDLMNAGKNGCKLCEIIQGSSSQSVAQLARRERMRNFPVQLKMLLQGRENPGYEGGSKLLVACGGAIIANFEVYISRGMNRYRKKN